MVKKRKEGVVVGQWFLRVGVAFGRIFLLMLWLQQYSLLHTKPSYIHTRAPIIYTTSPIHTYPPPYIHSLLYASDRDGYVVAGEEGYAADVLLACVQQEGLGHHTLAAVLGEVVSCGRKGGWGDGRYMGG